MRRLAPMFVMSSIVALVGANAFAANDTSSTTTKPSGAAMSGSENTGTGVSAGSVGSTGGTDTTLGYTAGDGNAPAASAKVDSTTAMNDNNAESKPTTSTKAKAKVHKKVASNADKTSINPPVDSTNGQAASSLTGKSGGAGGDSSSGSSGSAGSSSASGSSSSSSK